jgi:UDP-N-acetylmuramyl pentapeptide phosphotransferase/UDP-N-acetylglucosamine-1-phosphate transferase
MRRDGKQSRLASAIRKVGLPRTKLEKNESNLMVTQLLALLLLSSSISTGACILIVRSQHWHGKHTLDHDMEGVQKFHTTAVPRIGGAGIFAGLFLTLLVMHFFLPLFNSERDLSKAALLLVSGFPAFFGGIIEDVTKRVSVKARLCTSVLSALLASWLLGATVDELNIWGVDTLLGWAPFALAVSTVVVAGGINAVNIIDGFNGLASSTVILMLAALGAVALNVNDMLVAELAMLGLGTAVGFLIVNYPSGRIFLGDGGAYLLGFWVAEVAVLLLVRNSAVNAWQILSICAYPIIEVLYSIYRRKFVRQSDPGAPDGLHLHTLVYRRVVSRFFSADARRPWKRNAAVVCIIFPCVAVFAACGALFGQTVLNGILLVFLQLVFYVAIYARVVRGRWNWRARRVDTRESELRIKV